MIKKDKLQDGICCISIAMLIGGVATAALGQWWLIVIAIILIVFSLWWMLTASTSIEAEAGRCKVNFNGPLLWIDTFFKENALIPVLKGHYIQPKIMVPESMWAKYVDEAKQKLREQISNLSEDILDSLDVRLILQIVNNLVQRDVGNYMKGELARPRHRVDLESDENEEEHAYQNVIFYSPMSFKQMLAGEPSAISLDNYPDNDGIDVNIKTLEVAMIGMPMIQSTIPFIIVLPWLVILEILAAQLMREEGQKPDPYLAQFSFPPIIQPAQAVSTPVPTSRDNIPAFPDIERSSLPSPPLQEGNSEIASVMMMACENLWGQCPRHLDKKHPNRKKKDLPMKTPGISIDSDMVKVMVMALGDLWGRNVNKAAFLRKLPLVPILPSKEKEIEIETLPGKGKKKKKRGSK